MKKYLLPILQAAVTLFIFARLFGDAALRENVALAIGKADLSWLVIAAIAAAVSEILLVTMRHETVNKARIGLSDWPLPCDRLWLIRRVGGHLDFISFTLYMSSLWALQLPQPL